MREHALLLRLVAAELMHEDYSVRALRHTLMELGWDTPAIDVAVATIARAMAGLYRQAELFERAA